MKPSLARVKRARVKDQVFRQLRDQIVGGAWPPGSKIPSENALTRRLGVSRVSLREALHMLASLGLVESRQGGGTFVKRYSGDILFNPLFPMIVLDKTDLLEVLEYRRIVEKGTAALAAEKAGEKEIAELESAYRTMTKTKGRLREFARADLDFHFALARATGNPIIVKVNDIIKSVLSVSMDRIVSTLGVSDGLAYHKRIVEAVKAHDAPLAESLMEEHVTRTIRRLKARNRNG
ncbi:MAG: FadR family transcriptional regulator [Anaerolineales bacterium]|nr:FadR family transcriptional regulator [Anaerolineales bacterium]